MSRVTRRSGRKALVCRECVKQVNHKPGVSPRNVGSFRGRKRQYLRHIAEVHPQGASF